MRIARPLLKGTWGKGTERCVRGSRLPETNPKGQKPRGEASNQLLLEKRRGSFKGKEKKENANDQKGGIFEYGKRKKERRSRIGGRILRISR